MNYIPSKRAGLAPAAIWLGVALMPILIQTIAVAQDKFELFASLVRSKGYVVGSKLGASGLHRLVGDTTWSHVGWNNPRVYRFDFDLARPEIIFLASGNGALRSLDAGQTWRVTTDWRVTEALGVAIDPNFRQHVYLATAYGVWRSPDRGATWTESNQGLARTYTQCVTVDATTSGRIFAGTESGLYRSDDAAETWSLAGPEGVTVLDLAQSYTAPNIWLAGTQEDGVILSSDGGTTWVGSDGVITGASIYSVAIDWFDPQNMAAAGWGTGVFLSENGGKNWNQYKEGLPIPNIYALTFDATQPGSIWVATVEEGIFKSMDSGQSWHYNGMYGALVFDMKFVRVAGNEPSTK